MAEISTVNVGTVANDGTGDALRDAFIKVNTNITNLNNDKTENSAAAITGGTIDGAVIGGTTPAAATVTTLTTTGKVGAGGAPDANFHVYANAADFLLKLESTTSRVATNYRNASGNSGWIGTGDYIVSGGASTDFGMAASGALLLGYGGGITGAKIDSSGNFLVGTSSGSYHIIAKSSDNERALAIRNTSATNPSALALQLTAAAPDNNSQYFLWGSDNVANRIYIYSDGDVVNHDNSYGAISDRKLKQDEVLAGSQWDDVKALGSLVKKFRMKTDVEADPEAGYLIGFIAQDVEAVSPGLVDRTVDTAENEVTGQLEPTGTETLSVKYSIAYMKAFKALSEALQRIETLEAEVAALKAGN